MLIKKVKCLQCNIPMFFIDELHPEEVRIKRSNSKEEVYNINEIKQKLTQHYYKVSKGKRYYFDVIRNRQNVIKIKCPKCGTYHIINLDCGII